MCYTPVWKCSKNDSWRIWTFSWKQIESIKSLEDDKRQVREKAIWKVISEKENLPYPSERKKCWILVFPKQEIHLIKNFEINVV